MNSLQPFEFEGAEVRTVEIDGEIWFVAADVAVVLNYDKASYMVRSLDDDEKGVRLMHTPGGEQQVGLVSEGGLFKLIVQRQTGRMKDELMAQKIKRFQRWVTHEVLPAIRKTGGYQVEQQATAPMGELEILARANKIQQRVIAEKDQIITVQSEQIEEDRPKVKSFESFVDSTADYNSRSAAQILSREHGITIGQNKLLAWLRDRKWIGQDNLPYQRHVDAGRLRQYGGFKGFQRSNGTHENYKPSLRITPKGIHDIAVKMRNEALQPQLEISTPAKRKELEAV